MTVNKGTTKKQALLLVAGSATYQKRKDFEEGLLPLDLEDMLRYDDCEIVDGTFEVMDGTVMKRYISYKWMCTVTKNYRRGLMGEQYALGRWHSFGIRTSDLCVQDRRES